MDETTIDAEIIRATNPQFTAVLTRTGMLGDAWAPVTETMFVEGYPQLHDAETPGYIAITGQPAAYVMEGLEIVAPGFVELLPVGISDMASVGAFGARFDHVLASYIAMGWLVDQESRA